MDLERQEIYCHACGNYIQFSIDMNLNGNHVLECPICKHEHCRVVKDGKITSDRWDQRNSETYNVNPFYVSVTQTSTFSSYITVSTADTTGGFLLYDCWASVT